MKTNTCEIPALLKVRRVLSDYQKQQIIIEEVCNYVGVSFEDAKKHVKTAPLVHARYLIAWFLKKHTRYTLGRIGEILDGRHHSTILVSIEQLKNYMDTEEKTRQDVENLETIFSRRL